MSAQQEAAKWISLDYQVSVKEWLNEVVSIKQTFSVKTTWVKVINKTSNLKVIGCQKLKKNLQKKFIF